MLNSENAPEHSQNLVQFIINIKQSVIAKSLIPMGYAVGFPGVSIRDEHLCLVVPFFGFERSPEPDKSKVYPIRYVITALWVNGKIVEYVDMAYSAANSAVDYSTPIGTFRHEALKSVNSGQYRELRALAYDQYDKLLSYIQNDTVYTSDDDSSLAKLLHLLVEPALIPQYRLLMPEFAGRYLTSKESQ